ncbi:Glycosyl hydrolase, family 32 [Acholeplasma oculi]|uniref:Glycosyl hydrolase, family 32 n=2 Tax=Acholeplasma oculi TaxID=35623 RepID=A0A061AA21_9MOLU|nr:Glycosyl hydrolase, family 32 [Acholeplasma oculi]
MVSWNPTVDYLQQAETSLHFNLYGENVGDVHPFYENGQMYMYYLKTGGSFKTQLLLSKNMITYEPTPIYLDDSNPPEISNYYALGVYKDYHTGFYRSYFGMHNAMGSSKSTDLINWSGGYSRTSDFLTGYKAYHPYETFPAGGRDPYVFYDPDIDRYRLLALYYHTNNASLKDSAIGMLTSKTNTGETWESTAFELRRYPNAQAGEPEVPQMMKIGRRWYLLASESGITTHHVGGPSYWIGDLDTPIDQQDWSTKEKHVLDGEDLAAAQFVQIKDKYYLYGWLPQTYNQGNWGGYINIAHEVFQRADGTLGVRLDTHMQKILNRGKIYQYEPGAVGILQGSFNQNENSIVSTGSNVNELLFSGTYQRSLVDAKIKFELGASYAGVVIKQNSKTYEVIVSRENGSTYISIQNLMDLYHPISSKIRIGDDQMVDINLKLVIDRSNLELFINNEVSLVGRTSLIGPSVELGLIAKGSGVEFSQVYVSKLASTENIFDK